MKWEEGGNCWKCGQELTASDYGRQDSCPSCGRDTHACMGCFFYDRGMNNDCREPSADRVVEKERSNFCDYFRPKKVGPARSATEAKLDPNSKEALRAAADALFRKK